MYLSGIITQDGRGGWVACRKTPRIIGSGRTFTYILHEGEPRVQITQNDVRAIQLAKAALYAGVKLMMDHFGTTVVEKIKLAGAFGSHIDVTYAMVLGLIPDCDLAQVSSAGNAAGTGARIALLNKASRLQIETTSTGSRRSRRLWSRSSRSISSTPWRCQQSGCLPEPREGGDAAGGEGDCCGRGWRWAAETAGRLTVASVLLGRTDASAGC